MQQATHTLNTNTHGPGLYDITRSVLDWSSQQGTREGLLTLFIQHTSASLTIQENADPDVCRDLQDFFAHIAPQDGPYRHTAEGPDDMPAHIKTALTQTQLTIPLRSPFVYREMMPSFFIWYARVEGFMPSSSAAPSGPQVFPPAV